MKYTDAALRVFALKELFNLTTPAFWKNYSSIKTLNREILEGFAELEKQYEHRLSELEKQGVDGFICCFDNEFPDIPQIGRKNERPYLLFYKGDISLIQNLDRNVAVIGLVDPTEEIVSRERNVVKQLVKENCVIVSGLARGCDTVAHKTCLDLGGKTIAILPTPIGKIFPAENKLLAEEIVKTGGLLLTEYNEDAKGKNEGLARFIDRDRLQAILSKSVIMISSYRKDAGDSGSRHAMEAAERNMIERFVLYNETTDRDDPRFGLNRYYLDFSEESTKEKRVKAHRLVSSSISHIASLKRSNSIEKRNSDQFTFFENTP